MRILFLSQILPHPPNAGPKVRSYYLLRYLAQKHRLTLFAFSRPDDSPASIDHLKEICETVITIPMPRSRLNDIFALFRSLLSGQPFVIRRDYVPEAVQTLEELFAMASPAYDAVHADQLWMAQYALLFKDRPNPPKLVLDEHNACYQIFQRLASRARNPAARLILEREWRSLYRYESRTCAQFDQVVTVTAEDRQLLSKMAATQPSRRGLNHETPPFITIPICGDMQAALPAPPPSGTGEVLHLGTMFWLPNIEGVLWFAKEVWPRVLARIPEARFNIAGKNPPKEIQNLGTGSDGNGSIRVLGYVPDPDPILARTGVMIVPLLSGSGMRVKIIDGWSRALPIVSTTIGAEGIQYRNGENILIADEPEAFAQAVVRVLTEPGLAQKLRSQGHLWAEEHYNWQKIYAQWEAVYPPLDRDLRGKN